VQPDDEAVGLDAQKPVGEQPREVGPQQQTVVDPVAPASRRRADMHHVERGERSLPARAEPLAHRVPQRAGLLASVDLAVGDARPPVVGRRDPVVLVEDRGPLEDDAAERRIGGGPLGVCARDALAEVRRVGDAVGGPERQPGERQRQPLGRDEAARADDRAPRGVQLDQVGLAGLERAEEPLVGPPEVGVARREGAHALDPIAFSEADERPHVRRPRSPAGATDGALAMRQHTGATGPVVGGERQRWWHAPRAGRSTLVWGPDRSDAGARWAPP